MVPDPLPSLGMRLRFTAQKVSELYARQLKKSGLTLQQWLLLTGLWRQDGMTVSELSQYTHTGLAAISRLVGRMETGGWVRRETQDEDSRIVRVWMTDKSQALAPLCDLYEELGDVLLKGFSEEEKELLESMLHRLAENAQSAIGA